MGESCVCVCVSVCGSVPSARSKYPLPSDPTALLPSASHATSLAHLHHAREGRIRSPSSFLIRPHPLRGLAVKATAVGRLATTEHRLDADDVSVEHVSRGLEDNWER